MDRYISRNTRDEIARIFETVVKDGLQQPRDLDVAIDAILAAIEANSRQESPKTKIDWSLWTKKYVGKQIMPTEITPEKLAASGSEDGEQTALFCYALSPAYREARGELDALWALLYAIPNGGLRSKATAARMVAMGARSGYPDIGLDVARHGCHGLRIEMKRLALKGKKAGQPYAQQSAWHQALIRQNYPVCVCYGWLEAKATIEAYLTPSVMPGPLSSDLDPRPLLG